MDLMKLLAASCRGISMELLFFNTHQDAGNKTHEIPRLTLGISSANQFCYSKLKSHWFKRKKDLGNTIFLSLIVSLIHEILCWHLGLGRFSGSGVRGMDDSFFRAGKNKRGKMWFLKKTSATETGFWVYISIKNGKKSEKVIYIINRNTI